MGQMFLGAESFNQDIIIAWDEIDESVTNMNDMFNGATNFNQNLQKVIKELSQKWIQTKELHMTL